MRPRGAWHRLRRCSRDKPAPTEALLEFAWPGNVRQMRNVLRTLVALCDNTFIEFSDLPATFRSHAAPVGAGLPREAGNAVDGTGFAGVRGASPLPHEEQNSLTHKRAPVRLEDAECEALLSVLEAKHWHLTRVAEHLGISRNTLYRKLRKHGIARVG